MLRCLPKLYYNPLILFLTRRIANKYNKYRKNIGILDPACTQGILQNDFLNWAHSYKRAILIKKTFHLNPPKIQSYRYYLRKL